MNSVSVDPGRMHIYTKDDIDAAAQAERDRLTAPGPCPRKHPAMFWKEGGQVIPNVGIVMDHCTLCAEITIKQIEFSRECERFHNEGHKCLTCGRLDLEEIAKVEADFDSERIKQHDIIAEANREVKRLEADNAALRNRLVELSSSWHKEAHSDRLSTTTSRTQESCAGELDALLATPQPAESNHCINPDGSRAAAVCWCDNECDCIVQHRGGYVAACPVHKPAEPKEKP